MYRLRAHIASYQPGSITDRVIVKAFLSCCTILSVIHQNVENGRSGENDGMFLTL